jgi:ABC-type antimicrobial peptide transport system permease subunit
MQKNTSTIEINVSNRDELFCENFIVNSRRKMINDNIQEYIFKTIKNSGRSDKVLLKVNVFSNIEQDVCKEIKESIWNFYSFKEKESKLYYNQAMKQWFANLIIGVLFLILCLILVEVLEPFTYIKTIKFLKEGLLIISWVALWEPITFILFTMRSMKKDIFFYKKLSKLPIEVNNL